MASSQHTVLCWELGGGLGHLMNLQALTRVLIGRGHQVTCVLKSADGRAARLRQLGAECRQAPTWPPTPAGETVVNYSHMLWLTGYGNSARLIDKLRHWRALLLDLQPDRVVLDHAPTAQLAAVSLGLPCLSINTGFGTPPATEPLPGFDDTPADELGARDRQLLTAANLALSVVGAPLLGALPDWLHAGPAPLLTVPELDHYPERDDGDYWGPLLHRQSGEHPNWPQRGEKRIFAYLKREYAGLEGLLEQLDRPEWSVVVFIDTRAEAGLGERLRRDHPGVGLMEQPASMDRVAREADLVISHAGHTTVAELALAGVRQLLIPLQREQSLLARRMYRHGLALAIGSEESARECCRAVETALSEPRLGKSLEQFEALYRGYDDEAMLEELAGLIEETRTEDANN